MRHHLAGRLIYLKHMPTILRVDGFRFYFYSHEPNEPPHVHIDKDAATAKVWLDDATVARSMGFSAQDLGKIQRIKPSIFFEGGMECILWHLKRMCAQ